MTYPAIFLRVKAVLLDSLVFGILLFTLIGLLGSLEIDSVPLKVALILLPLLLFEPVCIWLSGGSLGHHYAGIRVINARSSENLFVLAGVVRHVVKVATGWVSLLTVFITGRHRSLHDLASGSLVVFKDESSAPSHYKRMQRDESDRPEIWRRFAVIGVYLLLEFILAGTVIHLLIPDACIDLNQCTDREHTVQDTIGLVMIIVMLLIVVLGLFCKLPGAFYRKRR